MQRDTTITRFSAGSVRGTLLTLGVGALVGASLVWWFGSGAGRQGVVTTIEAGETATVGEPFDVVVRVANQSSGEARGVKAALEAPRGLAFADRATELRRSVTIGDLPFGREETRTFQLVALKGEELPLVLKAEVSYIPYGLNKPFVTVREAEIRLVSPIAIEVVMPERIASGEGFGWSIRIENVSERSVEASLALDAPEEFETNFKAMKITLAPGEEKRGEFVGTVMGGERAIGSPTVRAVAVRERREYVLGEGSAPLNVAPSPLEVETTLNDGRGTALRPGDAFSYSVRLVNRGAEPIRNLSARAALTGKMLDWTKLASDGSVEGARVRWDVSRLPALGELSPGEEIALAFTAAVRPDFPVSRLSDRNFTLEVETRIEGTREADGKGQSVVANALSVAKIAGAVTLDAKAFFRDAASGVVNGGPFPPRVGSATEVSLHWSIASPATDVKDVEVRARLPQSSSLGEVRRAAVGSFSLDEASREVVWKIPRLLATTGVLNAPAEAVFQVRFIPTEASVGAFATILEPPRVSATDEFTGEALAAIGDQTTTLLKDDPTVKPDDGRVKP
ncbi:MAG: hypothetical protein HY536_02150 [Candidatus Colwellbacteria bacterium]|nr:hypothetical protein [Candidatus Colwellbacteria bacterium]